jgi:hypothetical protein
MEQTAPHDARIIAQAMIEQNLNQPSSRPARAIQNECDLKSSTANLSSNP